MFGKRLRILVIEEELPIIRLVRKCFSDCRYVLQAVATGREGIDQARDFLPDLVIMELDLPDMEGQEVICRIREYSSIPIIVLAARQQEADKIRALDNGADDYIAKPLNPDELLVRVRLALRHHLPAGSKPVVVCGGLVIDLLEQQVTMNDITLNLSPTEYRILGVLAGQQGKVVSCQQLLQATRGSVTKSGKTYIRQYIAQIRRKLNGTDNACYIINVQGVGYQLLLQPEWVREK